jgi:hypothetical protein
MNTTQQRFLAFLLLCIPARFLFAYIAKITPLSNLPYLGLLALLPATGFLIIYFGGYRKTGGETFGQKIWWNNLRPVHAFLYYIFAFLAINKNTYAFAPLLVDVCIGLASFLLHHYSINSFQKLI